MFSDRRKKILIIAALACFGFLVGDRLIITPLTHLWQNHSQRIAELRQNIDKGSRLLALESKLEAKWREMRSQSLPREQAITENQVFSAVNTWAQAGNLTITSQKPRWIRDAKDYRKLEIHLAADGSLGAIAKFLQALETDPQAQRIEEMQLSARDEKGQKLGLAIRFTGLVIEEKNQ